MSECPGTSCADGEARTWHVCACHGSHCPGCPVHGGDRLTDSERLHVEVARHRRSWSERTKRADVQELVRIIDRLAPKPEVP